MQAGLPEEKWRNIGAAQTLYRNTPPLLYSWIYSPLGRYGFDIEVEDANPEIVGTRDVTHRYFVCNLETGSWTEYKSNTGFLRSYSWGVDEIHRFKGSNANAVDYKGDAYIAITGYSDDQWPWIRCRLLPFNPLSLKPPLELVIRIEAITDILENDARFYRNLQPFCHGSRLVFRLSEDFDFIRMDEPAYPLPHVFFTIDLNKVQLDRDGIAWIGMRNLFPLIMDSLNYGALTHCELGLKNFSTTNPLFVRNLAD